MKINYLKNHGFTLIEIMIVVAIVGILASIAYPSYVNQIAKGRRAECRSGLLQSMQQQERYFSQFNAYADFTQAQATSKTRSFSGDSLAKSSCEMSGVACATAGSTFSQCIELRAFPVKPDSSINYLYLDSDGNRGCSVSNTRTQSNNTCWP